MTTLNASPGLQRLCLDSIIGVLEEHGYPSPRASFHLVENDLRRYVAEIEIRGEPHQIEVYEQQPVMLKGKSLFELELRHEFLDEATVAKSFAARLDRYLKSGEWSAGGQ